MERIYENLKLNKSKHWSKFAGYQLTINFEANFNTYYYLVWFKSYWFHSIYYSIVYAIFVYLGIKLMKNRKPFVLRSPLALWSGLLAIFSILGTIRCLPEFIDTLNNKGFVESICSISFANDNRLLFWHLLFCWSKVIEFGDTLFIILRKQKLINLHWIHHIVTLISCYSGLADLCGAQRWTVSIKSIHSMLKT
jgi:elongation of very long chain fatty acids protein 6